MDSERAVVPVEQDERGAGSIMREMIEQYQAFVRFYQTRMEKTPEEAHAEATRPADDHMLQRTITAEPDQVSWHDLSSVGERDPALAHQVWSRLVNQARDELASGHRAARAMEGYNHDPWDRAQFLALRESLAMEWQPRNGIEWMLVDMLAQAFTLYERELHLVMTYTMMEASLNDYHIKKQNKYDTPRLTAAETLAQAEVTMERYQRTILRTQRALRDQRRYGPVIVQHAGQVNVGQQQVNVSSGSSGGDNS